MKQLDRGAEHFEVVRRLKDKITVSTSPIFATSFPGREAEEETDS